jgi:DNA-binding SARP family transcriptional activator/tetratricopeptide (TPR) repeat protein
MLVFITDRPCPDEERTRADRSRTRGSGDANVTPGEPDAGIVYRLLGPIDVADGANIRRDVPPGRQQIVLATLVLNANRIVGVEQLIDAIWYDHPPATARTQVQICVSGLRGTLAGIGPADGGPIVTRPPGYLLRVTDDEIDVVVFRRLVEQAESALRAGRITDAVDALGGALALWRGPALSGIPSRALRAGAVRLDEERLTAVESRADLELRIGRHQQVIAELGALLAEHPLRERVRGQMMLALYRSGRQAEALKVYRTGRRLLVEQGLAPGSELRALETAILADDPAVRYDATEPVDAPQAEAEPDVSPHQLPADIADFTGRADLVGRIEALLAGGAGQGSRAMRLVVLVGKPGVGKSVLAVHLAHRLLDEHFPDGQLYVDLGGARDPASPGDVLGRFARALGVPGEALPDGLDERAEMFRSALAGKRVLVVLDDAASERQVRMLLPGSGSCTVIVTSRTRLTGLAGARVFEVDVMTPEQGVALLGVVVGAERVAAEPAAAADLVRLVGGLPLALRVVAARLAARPGWALSWMVARLADERRRLDELTHGDLVVRASLALSYDSLDPAARELLRLLSAVDVTSYPTWLAAALAGVDPMTAADLLELLVDGQLLEIVGVDLDGSPRYRFHEIIRVFARERLAQQESAETCTAAVARAVGGWLAVAERAHRRIYGGDYTVLHGNGLRWHPSDSYVDHVLGDPLAWLEAERLNICAAVDTAVAAGLDELAWDLATTLVALFEARCYFADWETTHRVALDAVVAAGNRRGEAALRCSLGSLSLTRSRSDAEDWVRPAHAVFTELGDVLGRALAARNLALVAVARGDTGPAETLLRAALADFRAAADPVGQAHIQVQLAQIEWDAGSRDDALRGLHAALELCRGVGTRRVEAQVRYRLATMLTERGDDAEAGVLLRDVLDIVRATGDVVGEGRALHLLGVVSARLGRWAEAAELLTAALDGCEFALSADDRVAVRAELAQVRGHLTTECPTTP